MTAVAQRIGATVSEDEDDARDTAPSRRLRLSFTFWDRRFEDLDGLARPALGAPFERARL